MVQVQGQEKFSKTTEEMACNCNWSRALMFVTYSDCY